VAEGIACGIQQDWFEVAVQVAEGAKLAAVYGEWEIKRVLNVGVAFESGSGDYAEYLERLNVDEKMKAGDIVGVFGGKITKSTRDAQQLMVVSSKPIVLGNMPEKSEEHLYEKVAFMGQIPVKVIGEVKEGDYIIPSGTDDGMGIALSPEMMTADEFLKVVGRAWGTSYKKTEKMVNLVVGLNSTDIANVLKQQTKQNQLLKSKLQISMDKMRHTQAEVAQLNSEVASLKKMEQKISNLETMLNRMESQNSSAQSIVKTGM